mmetsp:Transcript_13139/g.14482  ORF Transcript_13139/g.14482 Transcript_13139/m.14482 type:complete len:461 (-) Transcript_13139:248-1630(-)
MHQIWLTEKQIKTRRKETQRKMKKVDKIAATLGVIGSVLAFLESETYFDKHDEYNPDTYETTTKFNGYRETELTLVLRIFITLSTIILLIFVYRHYVLYLKFLKAKQKVDATDTLQTAGLLWPMIGELTFCSIHLPPRVNYEFNWEQQAKTIEYSFDSLVAAIMLFRLYLVWRLFSLYSSWADDRAEAICNKHLCEGGVNFAIKAELKERPYTIVGTVLLASIFIFGFAIRNSELPYMEESGQDWSYIWNGMWCIIITMTTVGFGDFYPMTYVGRIVGIVACFWGTFLVSLMVVSLTISSEFTAQEKKAYELIKKKEDETILKKNAVNAIKAAIGLRLFLKNNRSASERMKAIKINKFKQAILEFRTHVRNKNANEQDVPIENILIKLNNKISLELENIKNDCEVYVTMFNRLGELEETQKKLDGEIDNLYVLNKTILDKVAFMQHSSKAGSLVSQDDKK